MSSEADDLTQPRLAKLARLRDLGIEPYPSRFERTHSAADAVARFAELGGHTLRLAGRITSRRVMGKASFCHIQDGSGRVQLYLRQDGVGPEAYERFRDLIDLGDLLGAEGKLFQTRAGEITLDVSRFDLLAKALRPLPEKWHGLTDVEKRYRQRYLDLTVNEDVRRVFRLRSAIIGAIRCFLDRRGFVEVETPVLQALYGGAAARPFITHYNALDRDFYLRISLELYLKRLIVGGYDRVYELGRVFRNEGLSTEHNPEFTLLETYEAYADYHDVLAMVEEMIPWVAETALGTTTIEWQGRPIDLRPPWHRVTLRQAILDHAGLDVDAFPDQASLYEQVASLGLPIVPGTPRGKIIDELLSRFVEPKLVEPTFVLDYPVELSPLAKRKPERPDLVERFEGFVGGIEIANAFSELNDPLDQRQRFLQQAQDRAAGDEEAQPTDEAFLLALEHGMPPTGGLGIGIDRLVMVLTNQPSIREVILFPQLRSRD
ncbi:MAG: lysine--tRNA ligase [Chloroflexi bacterium]|nr:lysine--tRNA ligase [Chloroflexota bacterium]